MARTEKFHWTLGKDGNLYFLLTSVLHGALLRFMEYLVFDSLIIIGRCPWSCKAIRRLFSYHSSAGGLEFSRVFIMPYFLSFIIPDWIPQGQNPSQPIPQGTDGDKEPGEYTGNFIAHEIWPSVVMFNTLQYELYILSLTAESSLF